MTKRKRGPGKKGRRRGRGGEEGGEEEKGKRGKGRDGGPKEGATTLEMES